MAVDILDRAFNEAADAYRRIERIRNPPVVDPVSKTARPLPYHSGRAFSGIIEGRWDVELLKVLAAVDAVCETYGWQGISDESGRPCWGWYRGDLMPAIAKPRVDELEQNAKALNRLLAAEESDDVTNATRRVGGRTPCRPSHDSTCTKEEQALVLLTSAAKRGDEIPNNAELARRLGVHPGTVGRWRDLKAMRTAYQGRVVRGSKSADGTVEAIDYSDSDSD